MSWAEANSRALAYVFTLHADGLVRLELKDERVRIRVIQAGNVQHVVQLELVLAVLGARGKTESTKANSALAKTLLGGVRID